MTIAIKQNKKGTFLDLSKEDLHSSDFIDNFDSFTGEASKFLSGSSVSVLLPGDLDINQIGGDSRLIIDKVKQQLNQNNISIKSLTCAEGEEDKVTTLPSEDEPSSRQVMKMQEELESDDEEKEIVDVRNLPETLYVEAHLRSGQLIRYPGNVFVLGDVNPSAEIIAAGDIIIWGTHRGIAHAGADGDKEAKVIAMQILDGQIRIADKMSSVAKASKTGFFKGFGANKEFNPVDIALDSKKEGAMVPILVKIENDEIMFGRYFE